MEARGLRKEKVGVVISDKMDKTIVVKVETTQRHPVYEKVIKRRKKFYAHDEGNQYKMGDRVVIREVRPLSKLKRWLAIAKA